MDGDSEKKYQQSGQNSSYRDERAGTDSNGTWVKTIHEEVIMCVVHDRENCQAPFSRYNQLSNRLSNRDRFDNGFENRLYRVYKHSTGCQTRLTTGWMFVYTGYQECNRTAKKCHAMLASELTLEYGCKLPVVADGCQVHNERMPVYIGMMGGQSVCVKRYRMLNRSGEEGVSG